MRNVVFAAALLHGNHAPLRPRAAALPGVRLGLVTQDPRDALPDDIARALAGHWQVDDALDPEQLIAGVRGVGRAAGAGRPPARHARAAPGPARLRARPLGLEGMGERGRRELPRQVADEDRAARGRASPARATGSRRRPPRRSSFARAVGLPARRQAARRGRAPRRRSAIEDDGALRDALAGHRPRRPSGPMLFEEFVTGEEHSFDAVTIGGEHVWHSLTHYLPTPLDVLENPWIQWSRAAAARGRPPALRRHPRASRRARSQALGMGTGVSHMEWFRRPDGSVAVSEVGARPPGAQICSLISYAHDIDFYGAWGAARRHRRSSTKPGAAVRRGRARTCAARAQRPRRRRIHGLDEAQRELGASGRRGAAARGRPGPPRAPTRARAT